MIRLRGLGLNCPGDPGCPGYVAPGSPEYQISLLQEILANQVDAGAGTPTAVAVPAGAGQWIAGVPNWMVAAGAGLFGLALVAKGLR